MNLEEIKENIKKLSSDNHLTQLEFLNTNKLIRNLEKFKHDLNSPCDKKQISDLENEFNFKFPEYLIQLYENHNGTKKTFPLSQRLMSLDEVCETRRDMEGYWEIGKDICLFWEDGNSNYAGLYLFGLLKDKICFINHEETDVSPVFRNIFSFYDSLFQAEINEQDWFEMLTDYPILIDDKDYPDSLKESELAKAFLDKYQITNNPDEKQKFAFCAMNLLPMNQTNFILQFLQSDDMWIQERACEILGKKKYEKAIPLLAKIAREGMHNGKIAAMTALREFNSKESQIEIKKLRQELGSEWAIYLNNR